MRISSNLESMVTALSILRRVRAFPSRIMRALDDRGEGLTVLVVRTGALGDILRTLPPVRLLRDALPHARIHWAIDERWTLALDGHGDLDGLVALPLAAIRRAARNPLRWRELYRLLGDFRQRLREIEAGLVLDFHGNLRSGLIGRMSGAPMRLGYEGHEQKELNRFFTTHRVPSGSRRTPRMERNLDLIRGLGLPDHPLPAGGLPLVDAGAAAADEIIREACATPASFALINPGASRAQAQKMPPPALLRAASRALSRRGVVPLVVWGPGEESDARLVADDSACGARMAPATDLTVLAALLSRAQLYVGGDTGPLHLACAVGCPVLGLYGPTDPEINSPWGVTSRALYPPDRAYTGIKRTDRAGGGFEGLLPAHIETAVNELLDARGQV
jgi:ADP-heptose:LPS heptosyltransferase